MTASFVRLCIVWAAAVVPRFDDISCGFLALRVVDPFEKNGPRIGVF